MLRAAKREACPDAESRSAYVVSALRDLEAQAKAERAAIERLQREAQQPLRLPLLEEITRGAFGLEQLIAGDTEWADSGSDAS